MGPLISLQVAVAQFMHDRVERLRERDDRGMEMVQTAALIVLTLAIITYLMTELEIHRVIGDGIKDRVDAIFEKQEP